MYGKFKLLTVFPCNVCYYREILCETCLLFGSRTCFDCVCGDCGISGNFTGYFPNGDDGICDKCPRFKTIFDDNEPMYNGIYMRIYPDYVIGHFNFADNFIYRPRIIKWNIPTIKKIKPFVENPSQKTNAFIEKKVINDQIVDKKLILINTKRNHENTKNNYQKAAFMNNKQKTNIRRHNQLKQPMTKKLNY